MTEARNRSEDRSESQGSSNPEGILFHLWYLSDERELLRERIDDLTQDMRSAALRAREAGATVAQIGEACGVSRQAVYDLWKGGE